MDNNLKRTYDDYYADLDKPSVDLFLGVVKSLIHTDKRKTKSSKADSTALLLLVTYGRLRRCNGVFLTRRGNPLLDSIMSFEDQVKWFYSLIPNDDVLSIRTYCRSVLCDGSYYYQITIELTSHSGDVTVYKHPLDVFLDIVVL